MFVKKLFTYLTAYISKSKISFNVTSQHYFHIKTKILADVQICISVPLKQQKQPPEVFLKKHLQLY